MSTGLVIHAMIRTGLPHLGTRRGSTSKTFCSTRSQAERRSALGEPGSAEATGAHAAGAVKETGAAGVAGVPPASAVGVATATRARPRTLGAYAP